jgi:hypothetical protein
MGDAGCPPFLEARRGGRRESLLEQRQELGLTPERLGPPAPDVLHDAAQMTVGRGYERPDSDDEGLHDRGP